MSGFECSWALVTRRPTSVAALSAVALGISVFLAVLRRPLIRICDDVSDEAAGFKILPGFSRFFQRLDVFARSWWDSRVMSAKTRAFYDGYRRPLVDQWDANKVRSDGFGQRDFALRNASWRVADIFAEREDRREGFQAPFTLVRDGPGGRCDVGTPLEAAQHVKAIAHLCGAASVGITATDDRWIYVKHYNPITKEETVVKEVSAALTPHCIVIATAMDFDLVKTVPSALSGSATGFGYGSDACLLIMIAQYIKNLGYEAVPSMNDTALAIPLAIKAGLGEYGRHGLLITPNHGPRVRLGKIFTDMPLTHDRPIKFGVDEFCGVCQRCASACPAQCISKGPGDIEEVWNESNLAKLKKWTTDGEKCFKFWAKINTDCSVCIRVCPYNRANHWWDVLWRKLAATRLRRLMLWLDGKSGRAERLRTGDWWSTRLLAAQDPAATFNTAYS